MMDLCTLGSTKTTCEDTDHEISDGDGKAVERPSADGAAGCSGGVDDSCSGSWAWAADLVDSDVKMLDGSAM